MKAAQSGSGKSEEKKSEETEKPKSEPTTPEQPVPQAEKVPASDSKPAPVPPPPEVVPPVDTKGQEQPATTAPDMDKAVIDRVFEEMALPEPRPTGPAPMIVALLGGLGSLMPRHRRAKDREKEHIGI